MNKLKSDHYIDLRIVELTCRPQHKLSPEIDNGEFCASLKHAWSWPWVVHFRRLWINSLVRSRGSLHSCKNGGLLFSFSPFFASPSLPLSSTRNNTLSVPSSATLPAVDESVWFWRPDFIHYCFVPFAMQFSRWYFSMFRKTYFFMNVQCLTSALSYPILMKMLVFQTAVEQKMLC